MFKKFCLPFLFASALAITGCTDTETGRDAIPDLSAQALHVQARQAMATGDYAGAKSYLEALESRYPFGELTDQVQLDLIYVNYKTRQGATTTALIDRYLRLNPQSQYIDYVWYLKGLNEMQKHGSLLQDYFGFDRSQKDPATYYDAFHAFNTLIQNYPNSPYCNDAYHRLAYIKTQLAKREWAISNYYQERGAYLSAIRHCQSIVYTFQDSAYLKPALERMVENYKLLGLSLPASNTQKVIDASHFEATEVEDDDNEDNSESED